MNCARSVLAELSEFSAKVIQTVLKIPRGKVATYKQIAALCGKPHASRGVAWILNSCARKYQLPWQRVLNSRGRISFPPITANYGAQKAKLRREGIHFSAKDEIEMAKFQWTKKPRVKRARGEPRMFSD